MGVSILRDKDGKSCLYCSTTMWAFGPIFGKEHDPDEFLEWLNDDPRRLTDKELESEYCDWIKSLEDIEENI